MTVKDVLLAFGNCKTGEDEKGQYWELSFDKGNVIIKERNAIPIAIAEAGIEEGEEFVYDNVSGIADIICNKEGLKKIEHVKVVYARYVNEDDVEYITADLKEKQIGEDEYLIEDVFLTYLITNLNAYKNDYIASDSVEGLYISAVYK